MSEGKEIRIASVEMLSLRCRIPSNEINVIDYLLYVQKRDCQANDKTTLEALIMARNSTHAQSLTTAQ